MAEAVVNMGGGESVAVKQATRRFGRRRVEQEPESVTTKHGDTFTREQPPPQRLGGIFFYMTMILALLKDLVLDPAAATGMTMWLGVLAGTFGIGSIVAIPMILVIWVAKTLAGIFILGVIYLYFFTHGGLHRSAKIKRLVVLILVFITSWVPGADILPETSFLFFFVAWLENAIRKDNIFAHTAVYAVENTGKLEGLVGKV